MNIYLVECLNGFDLFKDIVNYKYIDKYLEAICEAWKNDWKDRTNPNYLPIECGVYLNGERIWIIHNGQITDNASKIIRKISRFPVKYRYLVTDCIEILGDINERELFIYPQGLDK